MMLIAEEQKQMFQSSCENMEAIILYTIYLIVYFSAILPSLITLVVAYFSKSQKNSIHYFFCILCILISATACLMDFDVLKRLTINRNDTYSGLGLLFNPPLVLTGATIVYTVIILSIFLFFGKSINQRIGDKTKFLTRILLTIATALVLCLIGMRFYGFLLLGLN